MDTTTTTELERARAYADALIARRQEEEELERCCRQHWDQFAKALGMPTCVELDALQSQD